jgi:hemin uptake protein HemP
VKRDNDQKPARKDDPPARPIVAHELFAGRREVSIEFRGDVYRLRITRNDKLILTK